MHKRDFPIFANHPGLVYLDNAATVQKPAAVIDAVSEYMRTQYANIHRGQYALAQQSEDLYRQARKALADFLSARDDEVVFTTNATDASNKIIHSLLMSKRLVAGDVVLLSALEHHANIVPRQMAARTHGIQLRYVAVDEYQCLDYADLADKLDDDVKVVALTMASNVTGEVIDMKKIEQHVAKLSARPLRLADASQLLPHQQVAVRDLGIDILYATGHKLGAYTGIGFFWGKKELLQELQPGYGGGGMIDQVTPENYTLQASPDKFEAGTPPLVGVVSLLAMLTYMSESTESYTTWFEQLHTHEQQLIDYTCKEFTRLASYGIRLVGPQQATNRIGVFSFLLPEGRYPHQLGRFMAEQDIAIRCGGQCTHVLHASIAPGSFLQTCRMSIRCYTELVDIQIFFTALEEFLTDS